MPKLSETEAYEVVSENIPGERARPYGRLGFPCTHYTGASAALQKVRALVGRETPQCRDIFDLFVLALGGHATRALFASSLSEKERTGARNVIDSLEHEAYVGQVVEFLEDDARARYESREAWDEIRMRVLGMLDA